MRVRAFSLQIERQRVPKIATLEFLQHHFSKMGHRGPPCDPHYPFTTRPARSGAREASAAFGGFVQRRIWIPERQKSEMATTRPDGSQDDTALIVINPND